MTKIPVDVSLPGGRSFFESLIRYGKLGRWNPEDMIKLIAGECDFYSVKNSYGYQGVTQIGGKELASLGYNSGSRGEFWKLPPSEQLEFTYKYFEGWRARTGIVRWESAGHLWHCNLAPAHLKTDIVYSELTHPGQYRANRWLDIDGDRVIERWELDAAMEKAARSSHNKAKYETALANLQLVKMQLAMQAAPDPRYDLRVKDPLRLEPADDPTDPLGLKAPGER